VCAEFIFDTAKSVSRVAKKSPTLMPASLIRLSLSFILLSPYGVLKIIGLHGKCLITHGNYVTLHGKCFCCKVFSFFRTDNLLFDADNLLLCADIVSSRTDNLSPARQRFLCDLQKFLLYLQMFLIDCKNF
jgi:hypothetical protein